MLRFEDWIGRNPHDCKSFNADFALATAVAESPWRAAASTLIANTATSTFVSAPSLALPFHRFSASSMPVARPTRAALFCTHQRRRGRRPATCTPTCQHETRCFSVSLRPDFRLPLSLPACCLTSGTTRDSYGRERVTLLLPCGSPLLHCYDEQ